MSKISFQCYACSQTLLVRADKGGQKAKCPRCSTPLTIPVAATVSAFCFLVIHYFVPAA